MKTIEHDVDKLARHDDAGGALQRICDYLRDTVAHYNWVGYYIAYPQEELLLLGPFSGQPTEHLKIPYGRGICGQAANSTENFVIQDVATQTNYLSCSMETKAEIVVPVWNDGVFVGELDIDSHELNPFTVQDENLLNRIAKATAPLVASIFSDGQTGE